MASLKTCPICCEKMHSPVLCECRFEVCRVCVRTYLDGQVSEPHCMSCKLGWGMEFLEDAIGKTYLKNEFKKQRASLFAEHEKTQLPEYQEAARKYQIILNLEQEIQVINNDSVKRMNGTSGCNWCIGNRFKLFGGCEPCKRATDKDIIKMQNMRIMNLTKDVDKIEQLSITLFHKKYRPNAECFNLKCSACNGMYDHDTLSKVMKGQVDKLICEKCNVVTCLKCLNPCHKGPCLIVKCHCSEYECDACNRNLNDNKIKYLNNQIRIVKHSEMEVKDRKKFIMKCQVNECKGFLSTAYKCGLCSTFTCKDCFMPEEENHVCNPDNVASTKMIKDETRPCPGCSTRIYKIDGCDQMWCTDCKTAFSWKTGQVINGKIHNPHYYEFMRNSGGMPRGDQPFNPCMDIMDYSSINALMDEIWKKFVPNIKSRRSSLSEYTSCLNWIGHHFNAIHRYLLELNENCIETNEEIQQGDKYTKHLIHNRILYLLDSISQEKFERETFMYHQRSIQYRRYLELITMLKQVINDILNNMYGAMIDILKNSTPIMLVELVRGTYTELFGAIDYYQKQHTLNYFTKIQTDHYDTVITLVHSNKAENIPKNVLFTAPLKMEDDPTFSLYYKLSFCDINKKRNHMKIYD